MNTNPQLKVIELRNYLLKTGTRERFIDYFEDHFIDSHSVSQEQTNTWVSEMSVNDFPRLPVIQDRNLLTAITVFRDEADHQSHLRESANLTIQIRQFVTRQSTLILYPTAKSSMENSDINSINESIGKVTH
jgi:hypothetical protein